ncbi:hypothetical protein HGRIS_012592 [Hohenbuehelia grisea]|uniref:DUF6534 domain-containing protein n=1 Tax=Hohenbuehelia grisea TaxID=104357 RepID=A0ABR3ISX9_9AGAR
MFLSFDAGIEAQMTPIIGSGTVIYGTSNLPVSPALSPTVLFLAALNMDRFNLSQTLSAIEIGTMVSTFLFGITVVQAFVYFSRSNEDRPALKWLVALVVAMELAHEISVLHAFYTISITLYNQHDKIFATTPAGIAIATLLSGYIACLVQIFFANRIRRLTSWASSGLNFGTRTQNNVLTIFCWTLSGTRVIATTATTVVMFRTSLVDFTSRHWSWLPTTCLVIGAVVDITVAAGLCLNLVKERRTTFTKTTKLIDRIMIMTIQTGLATSALTLAVTICFLTITDSFAWVALYVCLARVFSNSLLATLNYRHHLRHPTEISTLRLAHSGTGDGQRQVFNWNQMLPRLKTPAKAKEQKSSIHPIPSPISPDSPDSRHSVV